MSRAPAGPEPRRRHLRNSFASALLLAALLAGLALLDAREGPPARAPQPEPPLAAVPAAPAAPAAPQVAESPPLGEFVGPPRPPCPSPEMAEAAPAPPPLAVASSGFVIQTGVFNDYPNADRLKARLERAGIPARIETRVQAGPFADRGGAREAQARLEALGLGSGLLIPPRK